MQYAEIIKKRREAANLSQSALAKLLGVTVRTVSSWETGENEPQAKTRRRIEEVLTQAEKPSPPGDVMNRERALIKVLLHRVIKLEAARLSMPEAKVQAELEADTRIALADLEKE